MNDRKNILGGWLNIILILVALVGIAMVGSYLSRRQATGVQTLGTVLRPPDEATVIAEQDNWIWAGSVSGLFRIDSQSRTLDTVYPEYRFVKGLVVDAENRLWVGHEQGITIFNEEGVQTAFSVEHGLPDEHITCLFRDSRDRIWAGTWKGAACWDGNEWQVWDRRQGLLAEMVSCILEDSRGGFWFGSYADPQGGLTRWDESGVITWTTEEGLPHNSINMLTQAGDGSVWAACGYMQRGGAARLQPADDGSWQVAEILTEKDGLPGAKIRSVFLDHQGKLFFGTEFDGLALKEDTGFRVWNDRDGLAGSEVKMMMQQPDGTYWLATDQGISILSPEDMYDSGGE